MSLSDTLSATAIRLLDTYGNSIIVTQEIAGVYDPTTSLAPITTQSMIIKGLPEEYAESIRFLGAKLEVPNAITMNDKKVTIAGTGLLFIPKVGDKVTIIVENKTYGVTGIGSVWVQDVTPILVLHIRAI